MDPETHKEIVEIKRDIREIRQAQDAEFQHDREKYEKLLDEAIKNDTQTAQILLYIDGFRSRKEIQDATGLSQVACWRKMDRLVSKEVIFPLEQSKNSSPVFQQSRWFKKLRLEDYVKNKYHLKNVIQEMIKEEPDATSGTRPDQNQNS